MGTQWLGDEGMVAHISPQSHYCNKYVLTWTANIYAGAAGSPTCARANATACANTHAKLRNCSAHSHILACVCVCVCRRRRTDDDKQWGPTIRPQIETEIFRRPVNKQHTLRSFIQPLHTHQSQRKRAFTNIPPQPFSPAPNLTSAVRPLWVKMQGENKPLSAGISYGLVCEVVGSRPKPIITWWKGSNMMKNSSDLVRTRGQLACVRV